MHSYFRPLLSWGQACGYVVYKALQAVLGLFTHCMRSVSLSRVVHFSPRLYAALCAVCTLNCAPYFGKNYRYDTRVIPTIHTPYNKYYMINLDRSNRKTVEERLSSIWRSIVTTVRLFTIKGVSL